MLKLWEVVSVIQDLPYVRQLEILDTLSVQSEYLRYGKFRKLFLLSDEELIETAEKAQVLNGDAAHLTRLLLLYKVTHSTRIISEVREINDYFETLPLDTQIACMKVIKPGLTSKAERNILTSHAIALGPEGIEKLLSEMPGYNVSVFNMALERGMSEIVLDLIHTEQRSVVIIEYAYVVLIAAGENYLPELNERYAEYGNIFHELTVIWNEDDEQIEKAHVRAEMLLSILPEDVTLDQIISSFDGDNYLIAQLALITLDRFNWSTLTEIPQIAEIFNSQV